MSETSPDPDGAGPETPSVGTIAYDENGNLLSATDPNGNGTPTAGDGTTSYGYDRANRLVSVDYSDSTPDVTFGYDNVGNRVSMSDGSGTETRAYDALDRLLSVSRGNDVFSYGYDAAGNVTRRTYPDTNVVDYAFDPLNRVTGVTLTGISVGYAYDAASNLTQTTFAEPSDYLEDRVYDRAGRLTGVRSSRTHDGSVLLDITRTLDPVGNPLTGDTLLWARLQDAKLHVYSLAIDDDGGFALDHSTGELIEGGLVTRYVLRLENDRIVTVEGRLERTGG